MIFSARMKKRKLPEDSGIRLHTRTIFYLILCLAVVSASGQSALAQGKLLRGEKWAKFLPEGKNADFYVAVNGDDAWSGILSEPNATNSDGPFATIARAQQAVFELKQKIYTPKEPPVETRYIGSPHELGDGRDILVFIRGGYYSLDEPVSFQPEDGGERCETNLPTGAFEYHKLKDYYVTYAAYPGEEPVISGGERIVSWQKKNDFWVAGTDDLQVEKLLVNGKMQTLARTPNQGFYTPATTSGTADYFEFNKNELAPWPRMQDNRIIMLLRWHTGHNSIEKIDAANAIAYLKKPEKGIVISPPRYYVENVKALLDYPGEWFFDTDNSELYLIPPVEITDPNEANIVVPVLDNLFKIQGEKEKPVRNLRIYGLTFEGTNTGQSAISFEYTNGCELADSKIRGVAGQAVRIMLGNYNTRVLNNHISEAESGGIQVVGNAHPQDWKDIIQQTVISYNYVELTGGISIYAANSLNTEISHNEVTRNLGRYPINVGGWRNLEEAVNGGYRVEYNHVHHVQERADDSGAITTSGLTHNSVVRRNLIHDVKGGMFNDNVAIWFDNMSLGWTAEENIFYNLDQGDMKLCAANLVDNNYRNNHRIEKPVSQPEAIITGKPDFKFGNLSLTNPKGERAKKVRTGDLLEAWIKIKNSGSTGIQTVPFYMNGRVIEEKEFPIVQGNEREIRFQIQIIRPGKHRFAIGQSREIVVECKGKPVPYLCDSLTVSARILPFGNELVVSAFVRKLYSKDADRAVQLFIDGHEIDSKSVDFSENFKQKIRFSQKLSAGVHSVKIGNSPSTKVTVYPFEKIDISASEFQKYCAVRAAPCELNFDKKKNTYYLKTAGSDFYHGEDSYGAIYFKELVSGNFVATVKVKKFGKRTHEWFRAGLFARNDITDSFESEPGSLGSALMFVSPGRVGMNWDEHGDGCMHKANSQNHPAMEPYPMWIKLERHGNSFSGYASYDGINWTVSRHTDAIPGLAKAIHLGLAAGAPDQKEYEVEFENLQLIVEKKNWRN
ncbi:MAG: DUF1349 domain-containing protein [Calditrichaeota bacterium]|nr:MAG: DUF1349 domain-containing protein [Calditrichota bacterium]